ncbi:MAG: hypothetical protein J6K31_12765, partial [Parabacteroides sp.]|nr:hypothetical protein [Parabacteroides sp.]
MKKLLKQRLNYENGPCYEKGRNRKMLRFWLICKFPWHEKPSLTKDGQSLYSDYPIKRPTYPFRSMLCNM